MKNFKEIINDLKHELNIKSDKDLSKKLSISNTAFSERKRTESIPHKEIIDLCISEDLNLNKIYSEKMEDINYKNELKKTIDLLNDNQIEYIYHLAKAEEKKNNL